MGCVYLANQVSMDRPVALKVLPPEMTEDEEELESFLHEVRLLAKLDHPNIVTAFEAGEADGNYYMAMTYVNGETLEDKVALEGPLEEEDALKIALKIADSLKYAWDRHMILHRDVKPDNIMIDYESKEPRLLDMGISKTLKDESKKTVAGSLVGTPHYMSPEQAKSEGNIDCRADMYSLGCTLYQLLTGNVPYDGDNVMQVLTRHALDPFPSPLVHNPDLSSGTVDLLRRMMAKQPDDRFEDWDDLIKLIKKTIRQLKRGESNRRDRSLRTGRNRPIVGPKRPNTKHRTNKNEEVDETQDEPEEPEPTKTAVKILLLTIAVLIGLVLIGVLYAQITSDDSPKPDNAEITGRRPDERRDEYRERLERQREEKESAHAQELSEIRDRFQELVMYEQDHPNPLTYTSIISSYNNLLMDAKGTDWEPKIKERLEELTELQEKGKTRVIRQLRAEANGHVARFEYGKAVAVYRNYNGRFAQETEERRMEMARRLKQQQLGLMKRNEAVGEYFDRAAMYLIEQKFLRARKLAQAATSNETIRNDSRVEPGSMLIRRASHLNEHVANSFTDDIGKEIVVYLQSGKDRLEIQKVDGIKIKAAKVVRVGSSTAKIGRGFEVSELHVNERLKRVGSDNKAQFAVMRGILLTEARRTKEAIAEFKRVSIEDLRDSLVFYCELRNGDFEELANKAFRQLLKEMGIKHGTQQAMAKQAASRTYSEPEAIRLNPKIRRFIRRYGKSKVFQQNRSLIDTLLGIVSPKDDTQAAIKDLDAKMKLVQSKNKLKNLNSNAIQVPGGLRLDLSNNPGLTDLTPIADMPVKELILRSTSVQNLGPLRNMKLRVLDLSNTPFSAINSIRPELMIVLSLGGTKVKDLANLVNFPLLTTLDLSDTEVEDLTPLEKTVVSSLNLAGCSKVKTLNPLLRMKSLHSLVVSPDLPGLHGLRYARWIPRIGFPADKNLESSWRFWQNFDKEADVTIRNRIGPKVREALSKVYARNPDADKKRVMTAASDVAGGVAIDLSNQNKISDIAPLQAIPVAVLDIRGTQIHSLAPLQNAPLRELNAFGSGLTSLQGLEKCPLTMLDLRRTRVSPGAVAEGVSNWPHLRELYMDGQGVKNLDFLRKHTLTTLAIYGSDVRDLGPVWSMPLFRLFVENAPLDRIDRLSNASNLVLLSLRRTKVSDLSALPSSCPRLHNLYLDAAPIRNYGVLGDISGLRRLTLNACDIRDLSFLKGKKLVELGIAETGVRDLSVVEKESIDFLNISETRISDLTPVGQMVNLERLFMQETPVRDLSPLLACKKLEELRMEGCEQVGDVSVLAKLPNLVRVTVPESAGGITKLKGLPRLQAINTRYDGWRTSKEAFFTQ